MIVNLVDVKTTLQQWLEPHHDHRYLSLGTTPFAELPPTPENVARQLLIEANDASRQLGCHVVACHLDESAVTAAIAYASGLVERDYTLELSAARRTYSPPVIGGGEPRAVWHRRGAERAQLPPVGSLDRCGRRAHWCNRRSRCGEYHSPRIMRASPPSQPDHRCARARWRAAENRVSGSFRLQPVGRTAADGTRDPA
jgi:hypothetical protein